MVCNQAILEVGPLLAFPFLLGLRKQVEPWFRAWHGGSSSEGVELPTHHGEVLPLPCWLAGSVPRLLSVSSPAVFCVLPFDVSQRGR